MPSDGAPNVMYVIYKALRDHGPMPRDRILSTLAGESERCSQTLLRWTQLGLFVKESDDFSISPEFRGKASLGWSDMELDFLRIVRAVIFQEKNNARLWEAEGSLSGDLSRGLAWMLSQDIYKLDASSHAKIGPLEARQVNDSTKLILQNDTRWNGLRTWGIFLGFFHSAEGVIPDPTVAIEEECGDIFSKERVLDADSFLAILAERFPVLDGGTIREQVEEILDPAAWQKPQNANLLSTSLSRALWRLDSSGRLALESRSDSSNYRVLQGRKGRDWRRFTHIKFREAVPSAQ